MRILKKSIARRHIAGRNRDLIKEAGMELLAVYDAYTLNPATEDSERLFFVAREKGKKKQ